MTHFIKQLIPSPLREKLRIYVRMRRVLASLKAAFDHDREQFIKWGSPARDFLRVENRLAYITTLYHSLEKGSSLPFPRKASTKTRAKALDLLVQLEILFQEFHTKDPRAFSALRVLDAWCERNEEIAPTYRVQIEALRQHINETSSELLAKARGGCILVQSSDLKNGSKGDFQRLAGSRHSIRCFTREPVDLDLIRNAVALAQTTPSLCNRQSSHVHVFENDSIGTQILDLQGGNSGFGDQINKILMVTSELGCFLSPGERNQCWIEGGMFAMTLVHALHWIGLGTCCLNWAKEPADDMALREIAPCLPFGEAVVMLIGVGHLPEELRVTHSPRRGLEDILHFHGADVPESHSSRSASAE